MCSISLKWVRRAGKQQLNDDPKHGGIIVRGKLYHAIAPFQSLAAAGRASAQSRASHGLTWRLSKRLIPLLICVGAVVAATQASAQGVFGGSLGSIQGRQQLIINGNQVFYAIGMGQYSDFGVHVEGHDNYYAGYTSGSVADIYGYNYNNYFTFDLSQLSAPVSTAELLLFSWDVFGYGDYRYNVYDVSTPFSMVMPGSIMGYPQPSAAGLNIYNDLGSGIVYGGVALDIPSNSMFNLSLNQSGVAAIGASTGGLFTLGGSVVFDPVSPGGGGGSSGLGAGALPEPATWAMMILGIGAAGYSLRKRHPQTSSAGALRCA